MTHLSEKIPDKGFYKLGKLFLDKCDLEQSRGYFLKALDQFREEQNLEGQLNVLGFLIRIHTERLELGEIHKYIDDAEAILEKAPSGIKRSFYHYQLGITYKYSEDPKCTEEFIKSYHEALKEGDVEMSAKALYAVANSNYSRSRHEEALYYLDKLREILDAKVNKPYLYGTMYILYGHIYRKKQDHDQALENYFKAHRALQDKSCWNLYNYVLFGIGQTYKEMGQKERALIYLELAYNSNDGDNFKSLHRQLDKALQELRLDVDICIDFQNKEVHEKRLGRIDFKNRFILLEILHLLSRNPGKEFSKEELAEKIWGASYNPLIQDKLIYTNVSRLRKLIEPDISKPRYIVKSRDGYYFNDKAAVEFRAEQAVRSKGESEISPSL